MTAALRGLASFLLFMAVGVPLMTLFLYLLVNWAIPCPSPVVC